MIGKKKSCLWLIFGITSLVLAGCARHEATITLVPTLAQSTMPTPSTYRPAANTSVQTGGPPVSTVLATPTPRPTASKPASNTPPPTPTASKPASNTPAPSPTASPTAALPGEAISLQTADGFTLAASLYTPAGDGPFPSVVLAHMATGSQASWGTLPSQLSAIGYLVLTFDFRGHGGSPGRLNPPTAPLDIASAVAFLRSHPQVDLQRIGLVGASMGGMASVIAAASDPGIKTVITISSPPNAGGIYPGQFVAQLSPRPFLALGCDQDPVTLPERVRQLYDAAGEPKHVAILNCQAHANDILDTPAASQLINHVIVWLNRHLR